MSRHNPGHVESNGEARCDCPPPYVGAQCLDASEVADFMLNKIHNNLLELEEKEKWSPDCSIGECHTPDFSGQSFLEFKTLDNVAKFADIEVERFANVRRGRQNGILF